MSKSMSLVFLLIGAVLIFMGIDASSSLASAVSHFFTHAPTDKAIWLLLAGAACIVLSLLGAWRVRTQMD